MRPVKKILSVDAETYYADDYSLRNADMTTSRYIRDPRFEEIGWTVFDIDQLPSEDWFGAEAAAGRDPYLSVPRSWLEAEEFAALCRWTDWSNVAVIAHHAQFDGLIMREKHGVERVGWWFDTLSMVRYAVGAFMGSSLDQALPYFGLGRKDTFIEEAKGLRRRDFTRERWLRFGKYGAVDAIGTARLFRLLVETFPEDQLAVIDLAVRKFVEPVLLADEARLAEYAEYERDRRRRLLAELGIEKKVFGSADKFAELLRSLGVDPPMKDSPKKKDENGEPARIYAFAKSDPGMQALVEHEDSDVAAVAEMRILEKSTQPITRAERFIELGRGGRAMPVYAKFAATHTLRLASGDKTNFANLERVRYTAEHPDGAPNTGVIRKSIVAPAGYKIVVVDSSQIEPRLNAYVWGEDWMLGAFASGRDTYSEVASELYSRPVDRKRNPGDKIPGHVGKVCVLGLGYKMGGPKLGVEMLKGAQGGPKVQFDRAFAEQVGAHPEEYMRRRWFVDRVAQIPTRLSPADMLVHCAVSQHIVDRYRERSIPKIVKGWEFCDEVLLPAMAEGREVRFGGPTDFLRTERDAIVAPTGERLTYHRLERATNKDGKPQYRFRKHRSETEWTHGGKVTENIIQWLGYLVVLKQIVAVRELAFDAGSWWYVPMTSYDEGVFCVRSDEASACLQTAIEQFRLAPDWLPGLPLNAEGEIADRYGDAK